MTSGGLEAAATILAFSLEDAPQLAAGFFTFSEKSLFAIAQDIASGGKGFLLDIDIDEFNREGMVKYRPVSVDELLPMLSQVRKTTMDWVEGLDECDLDKVGNHPVLGECTVETVIFSIYAHQLLHMREVIPTLRK
jgi:hypothetical protein